MQPKQSLLWIAALSFALVSSSYAATVTSTAKSSSLATNIATKSVDTSSETKSTDLSTGAKVGIGVAGGLAGVAGVTSIAVVAKAKSLSVTTSEYLSGLKAGLNDAQIQAASKLGVTASQYSEGISVGLNDTQIKAASELGVSASDYADSLKSGLTLKTGNLVEVNESKKLLKQYYDGAPGAKGSDSTFIDGEPDARSIKFKNQRAMQKIKKKKMEDVDGDDEDDLDTDSEDGPDEDDVDLSHSVTTKLSEEAEEELRQAGEAVKKAYADYKRATGSDEDANSGVGTGPVTPPAESSALNSLADQAKDGDGDEAAGGETADTTLTTIDEGDEDSDGDLDEDDIDLGSEVKSAAPAGEAQDLTDLENKASSVGGTTSESTAAEVASDLEDGF